MFSRISGWSCYKVDCVQGTIFLKSVTEGQVGILKNSALQACILLEGGFVGVPSSRRDPPLDSYAEKATGFIHFKAYCLSVFVVVIVDVKSHP